MSLRERSDADQPATRARANGVAPSRRGRKSGSSETTVASAPQIGRDGPGDRSIEWLCAQHGLKMTGQRRLIARALSRATDHPSVEELYRRAAELDNRISIATVYRTVRVLEEKGILNRRDFGSGHARYEPNDHGPHYHLIDVDTGKVTEFETAEHEKLIRAITKQLGYDVMSVRLEVFGRRSETASPPMKKSAA